MTKDEIIRIAREAGIHHAFDSEGQWDGLTNETIIERHPDSEGTKAYRLERLVEILTPFATLVAAAEREKLAAEAERNGNTILAMQIRARGQE